MKTLKQFLMENSLDNEYWSDQIIRKFPMEGEKFKDTKSYLKSKGFTLLRSGPGGDVFENKTSGIFVFVTPSGWYAMTSLHVNRPATFGSTFRDIVGRGRGADITHFLPVSKGMKVTKLEGDRRISDEKELSVDMEDVSSMPDVYLKKIPSQIREQIVGFHDGYSYNTPQKANGVFLFAVLVKISGSGLDRLSDIFQSSVELVGTKQMKRPDGKEKKTFVYGVQPLR